MALRPLNSVVGYSVGANSIIQIIDAYGNVNTNVLTVENFANLGPVGNINIAGGANGQVLQTDGNGNLSWTSTPYITQVKNGNSSVTIPTANGNIYINATGDEQWIFDTTGNLSTPQGGVIGNIIGDGSVGVLSAPGSNGHALLGAIDTTSSNVTNYVQVFNGNTQANSGAVIIGVTDTNFGNAWTFSTDTTGANYTFEAVGTGTFTANLGNLVTANYGNFARDVEVSGNIQTGNGIGGNLTGAYLISANYFSGDGSNLANISANAISGQVANALVAGTVYTNAQPNITSVGTLTSLQVSGDITPDTDAVYNIGNATHSFKSLYLSGNTIYIGAQSISSNTTAVTISGDASLGNLVTANYANFANDIQLYGNIQTGNGIGGNITGVDTLSANNVAVNSLYTQKTAIPITTDTVVDQFPLATYRVAKYTIKVSDNTGFQAIEILLVHDSINSFITVYGSLSTTGIDLASFSTDVVGGNVQLLGTSVNSSASVNLLGTYVPD